MASSSEELISIVGEESGPSSGSADLPPERKTSTGSGDIQLSSIQVIVRGRSCNGCGDDEESDEEEEKPKKKKKVTKRKKNSKPETSAAEVLTKTLAQALRLINEQKEKERQKERQEAIRQMALAQKEKMESLGAPRVILHC